MPLRCIATRAGAFLLLLILAPAAFAQPVCGVKNHMRLVNRVNGGTEPEIRIDSGWQTIAPGDVLVTPGSAFDTSAFGTSQGSWTCAAAYGSLAFSGSGSGMNSPGNGIILRVDEWIGGEPKAESKDRLTVHSDSLAPGTPVTIRAAFNLFGYATCSVSPPDSEETFSALFLGSPVLNISLSNTQGAKSQNFIVPVGQFLDFSCRLNCTIADLRLSQGVPHSDTIQGDLHASFSLTVLTPGASLQFCSGALYAPCKGDLNADGLVDDSDFTIFVSAYNILDCADPAMPFGCPADLNSDAVVDDADFTLLVAAYNALVCP